MLGTFGERRAKLSLLLAVAALLCLSQASFAQLALPFDAPQYAAKVVTITGAASVLRDSQPWALNPGDSIQPRQMIMTGPDGHVILQVTDGSTIEVYPNSQFVFRNNPGNWRDLVDMMLGRIRVRIEHLGSTPNPNTIRTPTAVISVRGTILDVSVDNQDSTQVDVEEGVVQVEHALLPRDHPATVRAGESITVHKNEPLARNLVDRGILRQVARAIEDAITTMYTRTPRINLPGGGGPLGTGGGTAPGSTCKQGTPGCGGTAPPVGGPGQLPPVQ
jgi:hypothetical protein